jgi:hypothetical protein
MRKFGEFSRGFTSFGCCQFSAIPGITGCPLKSCIFYYTCQQQIYKAQQALQNIQYTCTTVPPTEHRKNAQYDLKVIFMFPETNVTIVYPRQLASKNISKNFHNYAL